LLSISVNGFSSSLLPAYFSAIRPRCNTIRNNHTTNGTNKHPPAAAVPIVLLPILPGPVANTNGSKPAIKANEVIRMGRNLAFAPSIAASKTDFPAALPLNGKFYNQNGILPNPINITMAT
jgi:hypothetical protein